MLACPRQSLIDRVWPFASGKHKFLGLSLPPLLTSHVSLVWRFPCLLYLQIFEELQSLHSDAAPDAGERWQALDAQPRLTAFICECLRLYPSIIGTVYRTTTEAVQVGDAHLPKGTGIGVSGLVQNTLPEVWGPNSLEFHPDRFLGDLTSGGWTGGARLLDSYGPGMLTFGGGVRPCLGRHLAMLELKVFVSRLLRSFRVVVVDPHKTRIVGPMLYVVKDSQVGLVLRDGAQ